MTSIYIDDWPFQVSNDFDFKINGEVLLDILQEFFPQNEFPLLFRAFELDYKKFTHRFGNVTKDLSLMQRQKNLTEKIYEKYKDPAMQARITARIDTINSILSSLTRPIQGRAQIESVEIDAFRPQKFYIEIGLHGRQHLRERQQYPQIELLVINKVIDVDYDNMNSIDFAGVAFNSNRGYSMAYGDESRRRMTSFIEFYADNVEDNTTVLRDAYELTYDTYVELIERLNPVGVRSLNYPRGEAK